MTKCVVSVVLVAVLIAAVSLAGCHGLVAGSGTLDTEEKYLGDFTRVEVSSAFEVEIIQSGEFSVSITADDNLLEYVRVSKSGETLKIGVRVGSYDFTTLEASVTMPDLYGVDLSGATHGTVRGFSSSHDFSVDLSGASSLDMRDMSTGDARFDLSGASSLNMWAMSTGDVEFDLSGASSLDMWDMSAGDASFDISGASSVQSEGSANDVSRVVLRSSYRRWSRGCHVPRAREGRPGGPGPGGAGLVSAWPTISSSSAPDLAAMFALSARHSSV